MSNQQTTSAAHSVQNDDVIRVYVGTDRSQNIAFKVLEHSIHRHTTAQVRVIPMLNLKIPLPQNPDNYPRTGFSFSRFCIPQLAGYHGKAIYVDADMMVFKDIRGLWDIPFAGAHLILQDEQIIPRLAKVKKKRQCSVMLLDCDQLKWDVRQIVADLDAGKYSYKQLMEQQCIVEDSKVATRLPSYWNHLDQYHSDTGLLHFTNMHTQPWMSALHPLADVWFAEVRLMLENGSLTWAELENDIREGYLRPSLLRDIRVGYKLAWPLRKVFNIYNHCSDYLKGYRRHHVFMRLIKESRELSIKQRNTAV